MTQPFQSSIAGSTEAAHTSPSPLEKLLSLDRPQRFLRPGLSIAALKPVAASISDTEAARRMQQARNAMFEQIRKSA